MPHCGEAKEYKPLMITCRVPDNVHDAGARPTDSPTNVMDPGQGVLWVRDEKKKKKPQIPKLREY